MDIEIMLPKSYLLNHKISDIANLDNIIDQPQDLVYCIGCKGVDSVWIRFFFGVNRGESAPRLSYKIVDIDGMIVDPTCDKSHLKDYNAKEIKFVLHCSSNTLLRLESGKQQC